MPYKKTIWINDKTKLNADNLNKIENGIEDNDIRIIEIENAYLKYVEFNHDTKELKFVKENNEEIVVNIPNKVIYLNYDSANQNLVLTLEDNTQLTTSLKDLLLTGSDNLTTKVVIENNEIKVELKEGSVSENYLSTSFKEKINNKVDKKYVDDLIGDINTILENLVDVEKEPTLITFTINGTEFQAEEGMTWREFAESDYNTYTDPDFGGAFRIVGIDDDWVTNTLSETPIEGVKPDDVIVNGQAY